MISVPGKSPPSHLRRPVSDNRVGGSKYCASRNRSWFTVKIASNRTKNSGSVNSMLLEKLNVARATFLFISSNASTIAASSRFRDS